MIPKVQFYEYTHAVDSSLQPIYPEYKQGEHPGKSRIQDKLLTEAHPCALTRAFPIVLKHQNQLIAQLFLLI